MEKGTSRGSSASSVTPIAPDDAHQERQIPPHNLSDAFDMVGDQPVYKTPSANVAVAMANLDRLPDTPEC